MEPGFLGVEICSEHRKPPPRQPWVGQSTKRNPRARETGAGTDAVEKAKGTMVDSLYKYVGEQKIPAFKLGNRWRFKKSRLDQWMEEKSSEMEPQAKRKPKAAMKAAGSQ